MQEIRTVRIICDGSLKDKLLKRILDFGATGYTYWEAYGKGRKETVPQHFGGFERIYIEVWCTIPVSEKIVKHCDSDQYRSHAMTVGCEPLMVSDSEIKKFGV